MSKPLPTIVLSSLMDFLAQVHPLNHSLCPGVETKHSPSRPQRVGAKVGMCMARQGAGVRWGVHPLHRAHLLLAGGDSGHLPAATEVLVCSVQAGWKVQECNVIDFPKFNQIH